MKATEIITAARAELGTPFRHQGRLPGKALDCAGLAVVVARRWHTVDEPTAYGPTPNNGQLEFWLDKQTFLERAGAAIEGDILLMRFSKEPQHLAIFTGATIIHSYESVGRVVEHRLDDVWFKRIVRVYRFKDVEHE